MLDLASRVCDIVAQDGGRHSIDRLMPRSRMNRTWLIRTIKVAFAGLTLLVFVGSLLIGASIWEALLITSSLLVAAVFLVGGIARWLLRPGSWLRDRIESEQDPSKPWS